MPTAIGDSITLGYSSNPQGPGWVEILQSRGWSISNMGIGSSDSHFWAVYPIDPGLPLVMVGSVDGHRGFGSTSQEVYEDNLCAILDLYTDPVILLQPTPSELAPGILQGYQDTVDLICNSRKDAICGPDWSDIGLEPGLPYFAEGNIHPNATGHLLIADSVEYTLLPEPGSAWLLLGIALISLLRRFRNG